MKLAMSGAVLSLLLSTSCRAFFVAPGKTWTCVRATAVSRRTLVTAQGATVAPPPEDEVVVTEYSSDSSIYARETEALEKLKSPFLKTMRDRGFLHQCTGITDLDAKLMEKTQSAYLGFDATADSLHVGSLLQIMILRHLQKSGHRPVVLIGGGT
eukprot:scaffold45913_cov153-Amphora_coffeaeformis.AAC.1